MMMMIHICNCKQ